MQFTFFSQAGSPMFARGDALSAIWTHEEFRLEAEFPYDPGKAIQRGQRVAFAAPADGSLQAFEVRRVETMEPFHSQRVTAEHIALAELSDEHIVAQEITNKTATQALTTALTGTLWSVGNVTVATTSSCNIPIGSVWDALGMIRENWNCYAVPRVVWNASGISGRYIDLIPAQGTWRGVRLSVDSNTDEIGVTYDDTETLTALYGYGRVTDDEPLTFAGVEWTTAGGDPANKPSGQRFVEDAAATAAYGRNGRARFGYYQNGDITDPNVLLQKTWEALQATNTPRVTISCRVVDLYRLGYTAQPIRLHDTALVEISPMGTVLTEEIIQLQEDLLDPTNTTPTIGRYIPNIIYIQRQNGKRASGRGGGGGRGQTPKEAEDEYFYTTIEANSRQIELSATELGVAKEILRQAGLSINAQGVLVYATDNANMWQSKLNVQADRIGLVVQGSGANASIRAASIVLAINESGSSVAIDADHVKLSGGQTVQVVAGKFSVDASGNLIVADGSGLYLTRSGAQFGVYDSGTLTAGVIVDKVNGGTATIQASKIILDGETIAAKIQADEAAFTNLTTGVTTATGLKGTVITAGNLYATNFSMSSGSFSLVSGVGITIHGYGVSWQSKQIVTDISYSTDADPVIGTVVTGITKTRETVYYLGRS